MIGTASRCRGCLLREQRRSADTGSVILHAADGHHRFLVAPLHDAAQLVAERRDLDEVAVR